MAVKKSGKFKNYLSLIKFSHTIFALPFAIVGYFEGIKNYDKTLDWKILIYVVLCMIFARTAAMSFNRFIDRNIDKKNPRTAQREIPKGAIKPQVALWMTIVSSILFIATTYMINELVLYLSPVALLVILGYSYSKRFTALCHFILGLGLSLAPIGAYLAVTGEFSLTPILFSIVVLFWTAGFDMIYALEDAYFDKSEKLFSIPSLMGKKNALKLSLFIHFIPCIILVILSINYNYGVFFWGGALSFTILLFYQHTLVKSNDLSKINLAFFTTNGIASVVFSMFYLLDFYFPVTPL